MAGSLFIAADDQVMTLRDIAKASSYAAGVPGQTSVSHDCGDRVSDCSWNPALTVLDWAILQSHQQMLKAIAQPY